MHDKYFALGLGALLAASAWAEVANDFDGDLKSDPGAYNASTAEWKIQGSLTATTGSYAYGWRESRPVPSDYDGDGITDYAVYHRFTSNWFIRSSSTGAIDVRSFGVDEGRPVPLDYDGDGKADLAVYQWLSGNWLIHRSRDQVKVVTQFGWAEGRPIPADYDGDGTNDLAVFQRQTANWYVRGSSAGISVSQFGWREARPVVGDYDGDKKADLAVYHPATGNWYIRRSSDLQTVVINWGWSEGAPVPGDYDGDGQCDIAAYHRRTGTWYIRQSSTGTLRTFTLGGSSHCPLPAYRDGAMGNLVILAFGDSITYGMGSSSQKPPTGYPNLLERVLEPTLGGHCITINEGVPGESTGTGHNRINTVLGKYQPDLSLIMEGVNDTFNSQPNGTISSNLKSIIDSCKADGSSVILSTLTPVIKSAYRDRTAQEKRIESFNPYIPGIAASRGVAYVDNWAAITGQPNWAATLMEQQTANHPNDAGYAIMREVWLDKILAGHLAGVYY